MAAKKTFLNFVTYIKNNASAYIPYNCDAKIAMLNKVNCTVHGLYLEDFKSKQQVSPVVNLEKEYKEYMEHGNIHASLIKIVGMLKTEVPQSFDNLLGKFSKNKLICQFVNTEKNKELLKNTPHQSFLDLSIIYRWVVSSDEDSIHTTILTNELVSALKINKTELLEVSATNMQKIMPVEVKTLQDAVMESLKEELKSSGMPEELIEMFSHASMPEEMQMKKTYIITNAHKLYGATSILYNGVLEKLSRELEDDLYLFPSSLHEMIVCAATELKGNEAAMRKMVQEINEKEVKPEDVLSNNVYKYNRITKQFSILL